MMNTALLLAAIAMVESNNDDWATGRANEISRYQIKPHIWKQYAQVLPSVYTNPNVAKMVAWNVISDLEKRLPRAQCDNPRIYATAWNWGITNLKVNGYDTYNLPRPVRDYVDRVMNLYEEALKTVTTSIKVIPKKTNESTRATTP